MHSDVSKSSINEPVSTMDQNDMLTDVVVTSPIEKETHRSSTGQEIDDIIIDYHVRQRYSRRPAVSIEQTMFDISQRLTVGKILQNRLGIISDVMCALAILSIILMIIANELTFNLTEETNTKASWFIKLIITGMTVILLGLLIYYHYLDLKLYSNQNALHHDIVGLTYKKILFICIELIICAIHPFPRAYPSNEPSKLDPNVDVTSHDLNYTARDVALGLPMFLRLYLLGRSILLHSHLVRNASLRSFGYLNRVAIDLSFLIKAALDHWPGRCLLAFCVSLFLIGSWALRACDYKTNNEHISMADAMWLFMVTFATIGYGDVLPSTYCGRSIVTLIGLGGILITALLITVLAQKLLLSRSEKYVHTFVLNTELAKRRYDHAADVIKFAVLGWYLRRKYKPDSFHHIRAQRKLFHSISCLKRTKKEQKVLADNCVGLHELVTLQQNINGHYEASIDRMTLMKKNMKDIDYRLNHLTENVNSLLNTLNTLMNSIDATTSID